MRYVLLLTLALVLVAVQVPPLAQGAGFIVNSTGDGADSNTGDGVCNDGSGACTLRAAIEEANATVKPDEITFNIPGAGVHFIAPGIGLPAVAEQVSIDATTQPGYAGKPLVQLDGVNAGPDANGIAITAGASVVRGLSITGFSPHGIALLSGAGNTIQGNYIGVEPDGVTANGKASARETATAFASRKAPSAATPSAACCPPSATSSPATSEPESAS
jgi:CSLREA domain-containing protein